MVTLVKRVLGLFRPFWPVLALIAGLIMLQRIGDLLVPFFAGRVIDAMAAQRPLDAVNGLVATAFLFWVLHGNLLPYVLGRVDVARFQYAAPRRIARDVLERTLAPGVVRRERDTALQQAVIERGELVVVQFVNSLFRVFIPLALPGLVTLGLLLWWYPLVGLIALVGGALDVAVTVYVNRVMKPMYTRLQSLDYERQRLHTQIFRNLARILVESRGTVHIADYDRRYAAVAEHGVETGRRFLGFNLGRGVIVNVTNLLTWLVGAWYVDGGVYTLGYFLASLSWSAYVLNVIGAGMELQKQWMETTPAIRAFLAEIDGGREEVAEPALEPAPAAAALAPALGAE